MKMLDGMLNVTIKWRGEKFIVKMSSGAILKDLGLELQKLSGVKAETMRLIVPKSSAHSSNLLYPFSNEHSQLSLQECFILEGKPITMMGVSSDELEEIMTSAKADLRIAGFEEEDERLKQRALGNSRTPLRLPQGPHIFCDFRTLQLPGIELNPPPSEALKRMHMLAADPGIIGIMNKHRWRVGIMTEMAPEGYVGISPECILGFNKNHGEEISLRLRTDDLQGFRKYESIKKTLLHELAHMVFSEHDANFYALNKKLNEEAFSLDWTRSRSHTLNGVRPSIHYDEEFLVGIHSNEPQKLGGNIFEQLESARFSSVAAAQRRFANNDNDLEVSEEHIGLDQDDSESNLKGRHNPVESDTIMLLNTTLSEDSNRTAGPDDCFAGVNNIEPDPDDSADDNTMESESYSETCDVTISPNLSSGDVKMTQIGSPPTSAGILSIVKISGESNPDDVNTWKKNLGDDKIMASNPEQIIFAETMQHRTPENKVIEEPDPDDSGAVSIPDDESVPPSDFNNTYEPDPDDHELKRIQDPVTVFYNRLQNSIEALRAGINPPEVMIVLRTLFKIISNVIEHPDDIKFKKLRKANPAFQRNVAKFQAAMQVLFLIGFSEDVVSDEVGRTETYLVLKRNDPGLLWLAKSSLEKIITL